MQLTLKIKSLDFSVFGLANAFAKGVRMDTVTAVSTEANKPHWGRWVKARAFALGYDTQKQFAEALGKSERVVSKWLKNPTPPTLRRSSVQAIAALLDTTPEGILRGYAVRDPAEGVRALSDEVLRVMNQEIEAAAASAAEKSPAALQMVRTAMIKSIALTAGMLALRQLHELHELSQKLLQERIASLRRGGDWPQ